MIEEWKRGNKKDKSGLEPCWRRLLIAVAAPYGGKNPALADHTLKHLLPSDTITGNEISCILFYLLLILYILFLTQVRVYNYIAA